jgi:hypothetical protein
MWLDSAIGGARLGGVTFKILEGLRVSDGAPPSWPVTLGASAIRLVLDPPYARGFAGAAGTG